MLIKLYDTIPFVNKNQANKLCYKEHIYITHSCKSASNTWQKSTYSNVNIAFKSGFFIGLLVVFKCGMYRSSNEEIEGIYINDG